MANTGIPTMQTKFGSLIKLNRNQFPKTLSGRVAWCEYSILKWKSRRARTLDLVNVEERMATRIARMMFKAKVEMSEEFFGQVDGQLEALNDDQAAYS